MILKFYNFRHSLLKTKTVSLLQSNIISLVFFFNIDCQIKILIYIVIRADLSKLKLVSFLYL